MKLKFLLPVFFVFLSSCSHIVEIPPGWEARETIARITEIRSKTGASKFYYDQGGRLTHTDQWTGETLTERRNCSYDESGRITSSDDEDGEDQYTLAYDSAGNVQSEEYLHLYSGIGERYNFGYDEMGRLSKITYSYRDRVEAETTCSYEGNAITIERIKFLHDNPDSSEKLILTLDGKRAVSGTSDAFKLTHYSPPTYIRGGARFPAYMGNVIRVETEQRDTLAEYTYVYSDNGLPESVVVHYPKEETRDSAISFTYTTE